MSGHTLDRGKNPTIRRTALALAGVASLLTFTACAGNGETTTADTPASEPAATTAAATADTATPAAEAAATAALADAEGAEKGSATFTEADGAMEIALEVRDMEPGFYGFHIHGVGVCEPDSAAPDDPEDTGDFLSAGGHLGGDEGSHPDHAGDLPALLVMENGEGRLSFATDRIELSDLTDEDGAALMIHSGPDNYGNVPERYAAEGPDEDTLGTGDAGGRLACAVIEASN